MLEPVQSDPKVCVPLVAVYTDEDENLEYPSRGTGVFFTSDTTTYLVTARHNVLPTEIEIPYPTNPELPLVDLDTTDEETDEPDYRPQIDVYVHTDDGWRVAFLDIRERPDDQVITHPDYDILAIATDLDPAVHGYTVFTAEDLTDSTEEDSTLMAVGFPHQSYPPEAENEPYSSAAFVGSLGLPVEIEMINEMVTEATSEVEDLSDVFGFGLNFDLASKTDTLSGMSGGPVLGDGLVGILSSGSFHHPEYYELYYPDVDTSDAVVFHFFSTTQLANVP